MNIFRHTHPNGYESFIEELFIEESISFVKLLNNYFIQVGESNCMFACHLDTVGKRSKVTLVKKGRFLKTDGSTILGADDKAGILILIHMIKNRIPGNYLFFVGEEVGGIGSRELSFTDFVEKHGITKVISFDRKGYSDIVTTQSGLDCVSMEFFEALSADFARNGLFMSEGHGTFTDSFNFIDTVPECTNISVGYFNEHTKKEYLDLAFLAKLKEVVLKIKWEELPAKRALLSYNKNADLGFGYEIEVADYECILYKNGIEVGWGFVDNGEYMIYAFSVANLENLKRDMVLLDLHICIDYGHNDF